MAHIIDAIKVRPQLLNLGAQTGEIAERLVEAGEQRLDCHERPDRQTAGGHLASPQTQNHDCGQGRKQRRKYNQDRVINTESLLGAHHPCLITGPIAVPGGSGRIGVVKLLGC